MDCRAQWEAEAETKETGKNYETNRETSLTTCHYMYVIYMLCNPYNQLCICYVLAWTTLCQGANTVSGIPVYV